MPYSPPLGHSVNFGFSFSYSPPLGHSVVFDFGGASPTPPPPGASQLPTGMRQAQQFEEDWFFQPRRRFAPVAQSAPAPIALRHSGLSRFPLAEAEPWIAPRRARIGFIPAGRRKRATLFAVL